jgi:hypothetical protein
MRTIVLGSMLLAAACGGGDDNSAAKNKLAADLVQCKNDVSTLTEQLNDAKAAIKKLQEELGNQVKLDPLDLKAIISAPQVHHIEGNVSPDAVVKVMRANSGGLKACYEKALKRKPDLQYVSNVTAHFSVRSAGSAVNVRFSPHTDGEMETCMAQKMETWKFPTFEGDPVAFEQPVNLVAK